MADTPFGSTLGTGGAARFGSGPVILGASSAAVPSYAEGTVNPISTDLTGALRISSQAAARSIATFTPTAAAYSANDTMDAAKEFTLVGPAGSVVRIMSSKLRVDASALQASEAGYRLHLYNVTPPSATADNGAWDLPSGDRDAYVGYIDLGTPVDLGSTLWVQTSGHDLECKLISTSLWGYLVTLAGFTPTAAARQVSLFGLPL